MSYKEISNLDVLHFHVELHVLEVGENSLAAAAAEVGLSHEKGLQKTCQWVGGGLKRTKTLYRA